MFHPCPIRGQDSSRLAGTDHSGTDEHGLSQLFAGVGTEKESAALREYQQRIPELAINDEIWQSAGELADRCRKAGKRAPAGDLLVLACARNHDVELESADAHFGF